MYWLTRECYFIEIDSYIKIYFPHYNKYSLNEVKEKYIRRANRINKNDNILFTYNFTDHFNYEYEHNLYQKLYELKNKYNILIIDDINNINHYNFNTACFCKINKEIINDYKEIFEKYL